jgi:NAD(P)-dependent dehydrogenase (short-subunit alcohol dehydrogenase family)
MLKGKVVIITGGAGLIGQEFVKAVVENQGIGIIADINEKIGLEIKEKLSKELKSKNIDFVKIDITSKKSLNEFVNYLDKKYGKIDALVNSAYPRNKNYGRDFFDVKYEDFCENVNLHLGGYFLTSQQFAKFFIKQGYGNIINIASIYGIIPPRFEIYEGTNMTTPVEYVAIKSAIIHLTKYMAKLFKGMNIRVNTISPGGILNNQPKEFLEKYNNFGLTKGMLNNSDLKGTLIYLLSDMSKYVNGQNIVVDDGWSL